MSLRQKTFLIWWGTVVLFIASAIGAHLDHLPPGGPVGFTVMAMCLLSWVPWRMAAWLMPSS